MGERWRRFVCRYFKKRHDWKAVWYPIEYADDIGGGMEVQLKCEYCGEWEYLHAGPMMTERRL